MITPKNISIDVEENTEIIKSCCFTIDKKFSLFIAKIIISILSFILCSYQLVKNPDNCTAQVSYSSLLSFVVSSWLR